ncbi:uncharacterized protein LOC143611986 [Bidens hawaiensis]|uniref:uncharacterized protein LOC143611986 n=1 Tax=Bidens hawaiensis TaxID=980011 RepID=UPI0040493F35
MWRSSRREIDPIDVPVRRRHSLSLNFNRSSLKDVANLFADDDDINNINYNIFNQTLDPQLSPCSTTATATTPRRLSIFHRVHLANKFARAFATKSTPDSNNAEPAAKTEPQSTNALPADKLTKSDRQISIPVQFSPKLNPSTAKSPKSVPDSSYAAAPEKLSKSDRTVSIPSHFAAKLNPNSAKSSPDSTYTAAPEKLTKSDGVISNSQQFGAKINPNSVNSSPDSTYAAAAEKLTKSDGVVSIPVQFSTKLNPNSAKSEPAEKSTKLTQSDGVISIPGAEKRVVIYTTSLRIVRSTFEACRTVKSILRGFRISIDERDLSMDSRFLHELQNLMSESGDVDVDQSKLELPRVFIGGEYIGGAEEVRQLHETGELKKFVERLPAVAAGVCEVCGDFRFIMCDECRGSRKCYSEKGGFRSCTLCNENGLVRCPLC